MSRIDEAEYADIVQQVCTVEFTKDLHARLAEADKVKRVEIELAEAKVAQEAQGTAAKKDAQILKLNAELEKAATTQELAVTRALSAAEKKLSAAENRLALLKAEQEAKDAALAGIALEGARLEGRPHRALQRLEGEAVGQAARRDPSNSTARSSSTECAR